MANPTPIPPTPGGNLLGKGGDNRANLTPFKPGERRVGRAKGTPNRISNIPNRLPEFMQSDDHGEGPERPNFTSRILEGLTLRRGLVERRKEIGFPCLGPLFAFRMSPVGAL